ncbi:PhzF family phenazine biosynthesis isomerase [Streptomyces sp. NPDC000594]|uniref:PhzF family phenazine biosynthesis protein n=1 Tax=Streptomyces sp. NPDC000594 TaxID=3154261 RepID=UPI003317D270
MIPYEIVHMFTDRPYAGSPLAVLPDATGLDDGAMAVLAAELGTTETAFVLPPAGPDEEYRVRVFQPSGEVPFGGHSAVGTAATLVRLGRLPAGPLVQGCGGGRQTLTATAEGAALIGRGAVPPTPLDPGPLLAAAGLSGDDAGGGPPLATGFGAAFALLPVDGAALDRARPDPARLAAEGLAALALLTWEPAGRTVRARLFAPGFGIPEDPACAPVAMAFGLWLLATGRLPAGDGDHPYTVRMGGGTTRTGRIDCVITLENGEAVRATAAGAVTVAARGTLAVPTAPPVSPVTATSPVPPE